MNEKKKGMTAYEKIVAAHLLEVLSDGSHVLSIDWAWGHEITTPNAILDLKARGLNTVFNPNRVALMIDHVNPPATTDSAIQAKIVREFSREHGLIFFEVGRNGICHAMIPEQGLILPGQIGEMGDSHTCTHGAFCALTVGVGTSDLEAGMLTGLLVLKPQKVIRVNFTGELPAHVFAKDLILELIRRIGTTGATNSILEIGGPVIEKLGMDGRLTMCNMAVEAGATCGMMMVDEKTIDYLWSALPSGDFSLRRTALEHFSAFNSDPDCVYDQTINIDVTALEPVITDNYSVADVVPVKTLAGKKIDQVVFGACTNGRIEDLRIVARIFEALDMEVHPSVRAIVIPATRHIWELANEEGLLDIFMRAGCCVTNPTCGPCLGMSCGVIAPGEVCVATTNRNFRGRMGEGGMVHLASPMTAALAAIYGEITAPQEKLGASIGSQSDSIKSDQAPPSNRRVKDFTKPDYSNLALLAAAAGAKEFSGKPFYLDRDGINTDEIIPAKHLVKVEKAQFGEHCLEGLPMSEAEKKKLTGSKIVVSRKGFGEGSSREQAVYAFEAIGVTCVIAESFHRIFATNMFNCGMLCIELPKEVIDFLFREQLDDLSINWKDGLVGWGLEQGTEFVLTERQRELIELGGSIPFMLKLAARLQEEGKL